MSTEEQTAGTGPDREKLEGALETIFEVLGNNRIGELRELVTEVDHRLSGRITAVGEQSTSATEGVRNDLVAKIDEAFGKIDEARGKLDEATGKLGETTGKLDELFSRLDALSVRLDELDERHKSASEELEKKIGDSSADLNRQLKESESVAEDRIRAVKDELGSSLASKEEHINKELDTLARNLSGIQLEFGQHSRATERMSVVLDGLANVLKPAAPSAPPEAKTDEASSQEPAIEPSPAPAEEVSEEILDNALERVFSKNPS
jgi:chromosome segregation ATPase